jgi:RNA polymerase sigma-70 factor, ECF subfamily
MNVSQENRPQIGPAELAFAYAVARRHVHDPDDAADVAQDALLLAHRHRDSFRGDSQYRTWLYRIVTTTALSHLRSRGRRPVIAAHTDDDPQVAAPQASAEAILGDAEAAALVRRHLDRMGPKYSDVFRMRFEQDLAEAEIARALHLTIATVKIRTHRARKFLQREVAPLLDP